VFLYRLCIDFVKVYKEDKELDDEEELLLVAFLRDCLDRKKLQKVKDVIYDKTDQKNIHIVKLSQESTIEYSFNDVDKLIELHDALMVKINKRGFTETCNLHCRYIRALAYIEQCGLPISSKAWKDKMVVQMSQRL
jgi:ribonuclease D